jgi:glycosyltransferase involved in cell wall biosynthesis
LSNLLSNTFDIYIEILGNYSNASLKRLNDSIIIYNNNSFTKCHFNALEKKNIFGYAYRLFNRLLKKIRIERIFFTAFYKNKLPILFYDIVISYSGYQGFSNYVALKVNSKIKLTWIHSDPYELGFHKLNLRRVFLGFDKIILVSQHNYERLRSIDSDIVKKAIVVYNILDYERVLSKSLMDHDLVINKDLLASKRILLTVSRIEENAKKLSRIVEVMKSLINDNIKDYRWIIIGDGPDFSSLKKSITQNSLTDYIFMLGKIDNPYPYFKLADMFILTSDFEGLPVTLMEAKIMNLFIVSTDFGSVREIITSDKIGLITSKNPIEIKNSILSGYEYTTRNKDQYIPDNFNYKNIDRILWLFNDMINK